MARSLSSPSVEAKNFITVLSVIDRTILPRRLLLTNGQSRLVLLAARQSAFFDAVNTGAQSGTVERMAAALVRLCSAGRPITYRIEPLKRAEPPHGGFPAMAILRAQDGAEAEHTDDGGRHFRFAGNGWPLAAPHEASFASLKAATRIAWAMASWHGLHAEELQPPTLIAAVSDAVTDELSVSIEGSVTVTSAPPARLGHLVSRWRNRPGEDAS